MYIYGQLRKAQLENLASDPSPASDGRIYYNTSTGAVRAYLNGAWVTAISATGLATAADITFTPGGSLISTDVQAALLEASGNLDTHLAGATAAHAASAISFTPGGTIAGSNLQTAVAEVATDAAAALAAHEADTTVIHGITDTAALVTLTGAQTLTNKGFDAANNTLTNVDNAAIKAAAAIAINKLAALTASKLLVSDGSGFISASSVSSTEAGYLSGVTSAIQTQLGGKVDKSAFTTKGDIMVATGASTPARVGVGSDGQVPVADSSAASGLAWKTLQQGAKNYITYNSFENNATTGWSLCTVGAVDSTTKAVSGSLTTGTAASMSALATTSTNPLAGTYSLQTAAGTAWAQKEGFCSQAYTIDREDLAKPMSFKAYFEVPTGSSLINCSGTTSNTFAVWLYDVTNSAWVQPSGCYSMTQLTGVGVIQGSFQLPSTCTSFRLVIVCVNTPTAGALTINWDDFSVGPVVTTVGSPETDWVPYTPTFSGLTATLIGAESRRSGPDLLVRIKATKTAGAASEIRVSLGYAGGNSNVTSKSTIATLERCGSLVEDGNDASIYSALIEPSVGYLTVGYTDSGSATLAKKNGNVVFGTGATFFIEARIPIQGWSSSVTMSSDSDTRVIFARAHRSGNQSLSNATETTILFDTIDYNPNGAYASGTGKFTASVSGYYKFGGAIGYAANATGVRAAAYKKNAGTATYMAQLPNVGASLIAVVPYSGAEYLNAGETIEIVGYQDSTAALNVNTLSFFWISRESGPAVVAASEKVAARYSTAAGQSISTGSTTIIDFGASSFDTHGSVTTGASWKFTAQRPDYYTVAAVVALAGNSGLAAGESVDLYLYKNGAAYSRFATATTWQGNTTTQSLSGTDGVQLNAGEYIDIRINQGSGGSIALVNNAEVNHVYIRAGA
jgi:hypothetical protein